MAVKRRFPVRVATVYCNGGCRAKRKMEFQANSCAEAQELCVGGPLECTYGCLGCGTCAQTCRFDAIQINLNGVAEVDEGKCIGCGACVRKCPRDIIRIRLQGAWMVPLCSNRDKGFDPKTKSGARTVCDVSCIGCGLCVKNCPADAIQIVDFHAVVDEAKCLSCGACATVCPRHVIVDKQGIITQAR